MRSYGQIGWRIAAIAAFVGTAALAVVLTRVPGNTVAALSSELTGRACAASGLEAWLGQGAASAGQASTDRAGASTDRAGVRHGGGTYYTLEFTNVSQQACRLYGYPEVSAYQDSPVAGENQAGGQIGRPATHDTSVYPRPVMLQPGATAHAGLRVVTTASTEPATCSTVTAQGLRIALPSEGRPAFVPVHIPVCSSKGAVSLSVQAIQARPGVPGYAARP
jgi:Domain of unknown function (DUF4232)